MKNCFNESGNYDTQSGAIVPVLVSKLPAYENCYMSGRAVSVPGVPLTYRDWTEKAVGHSEPNTELISYMNTEKVKQDYICYYLENGKLSWSGCWMTGAINSRTGSFEAITYRAPFVNSTWDKWGEERWYSTESYVKQLLKQYLDKNSGDLIFDDIGTALQADLRSNNIAYFSKNYASYFSYTYSVKDEGTHTVRLGFSNSWAEINETTRFCVMLNERIIWPTEDIVSIHDPLTWAGGYYNIYDLLTSSEYAQLESMHQNVKCGDMIHFVVSDRKESTVRVNPCVLIDDAENACTNTEKCCRTTVWANPGETVDLSAYAVNLCGELVSGRKIAWTWACKELAYQISCGKYVRAPQKTGVYKLSGKHGDYIIAVQLAVANENEKLLHHSVSQSSLTVTELEKYGKKALKKGVEVPEYWKWSLNTAVCEARRNIPSHGSVSSFIFVTDMHWENNNKNSIKLANYLGTELEIEHLIFGGDLLCGKSTKEEAKLVCENWLAAMNQFHGKWYAVHGNHDNNGAWLPNTLDDVFTDDEYYDLIIKHSSNACTDGTKRLYNFADDMQNRIRYYFLADDSHGFTKDGLNVCTKPGVDSVPYFEQLEWMKKTVEELDSDWGIVVVEHRLFASLGKNGKGEPSEFCEMLLPVLREIRKTNEIIGVFSGHTHWDDNILTDDGINIIATTSDSVSGPGDPFLPLLKAGTCIEQALDLVQIDRHKKKIYMTRIGSGACREFDY